MLQSRKVDVAVSNPSLVTILCYHENCSLMQPPSELNLPRLSFESYLSDVSRFVPFCLDFLY